MTYIVQPGDTLFAIARRFNTTVKDLLAANPEITDPDVILPGQVIVLPPTEKLCPLLRQGDRGPDVRRFQTLLKIAGFDPGPLDGIFGPRTQAALLAAQRTFRELDITGVADLETWVGLGAQCEPRPQVTSYIVRPSDSLFIIATRFNVTIESILQLNPGITDPNVIFAGQVIKIPPS